MYKTRLQELCHQKVWNLPEYSIIRDGPDHCTRFHATVAVNGRSFNAPSPATSSKKAQNDAAKAAFDYFSSSSVPVAISASNTNIDLDDKVTTGGTTQAQDKNGMPQVNAKSNSGGTSATQAQDTNGMPQVNGPTTVAKIDHNFPVAENLCKNRLQSYAQKKSLALPFYSCERIGPPHAMHFKCKVTVGGQTYECQELFTTLSKAEQAAARVALMSVQPEGIEEDASAYKSLLQELAQKECYQLPTYSTSSSGESHKRTFISTVEVGGQMFSGLEAKTKKQAEFTAAKVACTALKRCNSKQNPLPSNSGISSAHPIDSSSSNLRQSMSLDNSNQIAQCTSSSRDLTAYLHKNAPIQPELSGCDEEPLEEKGIVEIAEVVRVVPPVVTPQQASCPSSGSGMLSLPKVGLLSSSSPSDSSTNSVVILSGEHEKVTNVSSQNKVIVHPRSINMSYPPGSTVLSMSDDNWVAVGISSGSGDKAL
ncbi:double-stranded RNA-binding protein 1-like [Euphorbia lathyris]|uniref:double-stranded RNA-binding protein 1-like n=1 Tax=Euphorbia lathyris TaxID=212925 RepID=UPI003313277B